PTCWIFCANIADILSGSDSLKALLRDSWRLSKTGGDHCRRTKVWKKLWPTFKIWRNQLLHLICGTGVSNRHCCALITTPQFGNDWFSRQKLKKAAWISCVRISKKTQ